MLWRVAIEAGARGRRLQSRIRGLGFVARGAAAANAAAEAEAEDARVSPGAIHLRLATRDHLPVFLDERIGEDLLAAVRGRPGCLGVCVMPDHLHWLVRPVGAGHSLHLRPPEDGDRSGTGWREEIAAVRAISTVVVGNHGWRSPLWEDRCWCHVLPEEASIACALAYVLENPRRAGLHGARRCWPTPPAAVLPPRVGADTKAVPALAS